jgi:hypothetical protein
LHDHGYLDAERDKRPSRLCRLVFRAHHASNVRYPSPNHQRSTFDSNWSPRLVRGSHSWDVDLPGRQILTHQTANHSCRLASHSHRQA